MRIVLIGFVGLATAMSGCQSDMHGAGASGHTDTALLQDQTAISGEKADLVVYGMSCPLCATSLDKELARLPGFASMTSDLGNGKVTVTFKGEKRPTHGQLAQAVQNAGFTLKSIN